MIWLFAQNREAVGCFREVEPFVVRFGNSVRKHDVAVARRANDFAVGARADNVAGFQSIETLPPTREGVGFVELVDDGAEVQALNVCRARRWRVVGYAEQRERVADRAICDFGAVRIVVLAAFERERRAARGAHVFRGADAVLRMKIVALFACWIEFRRACDALRDADGVGRKPAVDRAVHAEAQRPIALDVSVNRRLERAAVIGWSHHHERLSLRLKRMQIEQHFVLRHERTKPIRDVIFELGGRNARRRRREIAIEISVTDAPFQRVRHRVRDRHEGDAAACDFERAAFDFGDYTANAMHAREFVAVHRAKNQDALAGFNGGE